MKDLINQLFANLDSWRHFPSYQLERRADIFFSVYLADFLEETRGYDVQAIIPEFPIRVGTVDLRTHVNKSFKIDYLVKLRIPNKVIFIELKTDDTSRREKQDSCLREAKKKGMTALLLGLKKIYAATNAKSKYDHLLRALESADLIRFNDHGGFDPIDQASEISILYLQPHAQDETDTITFSEMAEYVGKRQDDLSKRFSESLMLWASVTAGASSA